MTRDPAAAGPLVHPTAVVEEGAELHAGVVVGPYAVIGARVRLGPRTTVGAHAVLLGETRLGADNVVGPHAILGGAPQVRELGAAGAAGAAGALRLGDGNVLRELVTVHVGRPGGETVIADRCLLMVGSHVGHDCHLGSGVELANGVQLAGHVVVEEHATLAGVAAVHQFARVGAYAFVAAGAMVAQDVLPYSLAAGDRARTCGANVVGLRRHGLDAAVRRAIARALRLLLGAPTLRAGVAAVRDAFPGSEHAARIAAFAESAARGICGPPPRRAYATPAGEPT